MVSIEKSIKQQFARVFQRSDWRRFKRVADVYLRQAAFLRKRDIKAPPNLKLLLRNSQKRLLIGVGVELLLKALYLKNGYAINKPEDGNKTLRLPFRIEKGTASHLLDDETFTLANLIDHTSNVIRLSDGGTVMRGLKIAKVFRNKEGHVVTSQHAFDPANYRDIELTLRELYRQGFSESLSVRFSLERNEHPIWKVVPL
jgi:hypothetical protein